jgi:hypothetical protein
MLGVEQAAQLMMLHSMQLFSVPREKPVEQLLQMLVEEQP